MNNDIAIDFRNVCKNYKLYKKYNNTILTSILFSKNVKEKIVLKDVSFQIKKGESVVIIGKNGMGKSTILKLISGITYPTSGSISVYGKLNAILELNSGFENDLTGRENIYLKCKLLGLKTSEIKAIEDKIIDFADIGEYIDQPIRTYSTGMKSRLGFSISINTAPEILVLDEVFSVGDHYFRQKCFEKIKEFLKDNNHTLLLVTHSIDIAREFCQRGILIENGTIQYDGNIDECINLYLKNSTKKHD